MIISSSNRTEWSNPDFWREKLPSLTITDIPAGGESVDGKNAATDNPKGQIRRKQLQTHGFALVDEPIAPQEDIERLRQGITHLHRNLKVPASFILLFDETWHLAEKSKKVLNESTLETNRFHADILAWYIEDNGFSPHRDRQPDEARESFSGLDAKFVTQWIALSEASPENSCLYMIPKAQDPGYVEGDSEAADPLCLALPNKQAYQYIRAFPRRQGQSVLFTHRIIHWGSKRVPDTNQQHRIAISFVCADPAFERPYVDSKHLDNGCPPFHIRLLLVCAQMLMYYQRFNLSKDSIRGCYEFCKANEDELEESYRQKVFVEFVKAMKEQKAADPASSVPANGIQNSEEEDPDEEAMMEEMLQAAQKGYGEFADDYDEEFDNEEEGERDEDFDVSKEEEDAVLQFRKRSLSDDNLAMDKKLKSKH